MDSAYNDVSEIRKVFSSEGCFCREDGCDFRRPDAGDRTDELINHYIAAHQYRILFIGTETDSDPEPRSYTVVVLGR